MGSSNVDWRDITPELELTYYCWALHQFGPVHSFTARFRDDVEAEARAKGKKMLTWLRARIARYLKQDLGRHVELVVVPEEDENGRLHLHGEFQISVEEAPIARKAMRDALGEWREARQYQVLTKFEPDHGYACYCAIDLWRSKSRLRTVFKWMAVGFECKPSSATKLLRARAEELYTHDRAMVIEARKEPTSRPAEDVQSRITFVFHI